MSGAINNGGSAFPIPNDDRPGAYPAEPGMDLRDWFAGQFAAAIISGNTAAQVDIQHEDAPTIAKSAYFMAGVMIAARKGDAA